MMIDVRYGIFMVVQGMEAWLPEGFNQNSINQMRRTTPKTMAAA